MHRISTESFHIDAVVVEYMPIEAIVMPGFQVSLTLEIRFEVVDQTCIFTKVVNEDSRAPTEIVLRTCEERGADNLTLPNWRLSLYVQIHRFRIPCNYCISPHEYIHTFTALIGRSHEGYSWQNSLHFALLRITLNNLSFIILKLFVIEVTCVLIIQRINASPSNFRSRSVPLSIESIAEGRNFARTSQ